MSNKEFINNLSSTYADVRRLDVKKINLKGKNIEELLGLNLPADYKKFITRCELPEDENWAIWDDNGNLLYMNFSDKIINGSYMFYGCSNLSLFSYDLSSLTDGYRMFQNCSNLSSFTSDLSSLINGTNMFSSCPNLTTFTSDLSSLSEGTYMFSNCYNLTTFTSDLNSLSDGSGMFSNCNLDSNSIENILTTIPTLTNAKTLTIGIRESAASKFAEITGLTPSTTEQTVSYKGWNVKVKINN